MKEEKKNLTIRIDEKVLEKARALGLNLSATTESILKTASLAEGTGIVKTQDLRNHFTKVFIEIIEIMKKWEVASYLEVGRYAEWDEERGPIFDHIFYLTPEGKIEEFLDGPEHTVGSWRLNENWPTQHIHRSDKLIAKLVDVLYRRAEMNRVQLEDIGILKNILTKLKKKDEDDPNNNHPSTKAEGKNADVDGSVSSG